MSGIYYPYDHHNYSIDEDYAFMRYSPRPLKLMLYDINKTVYTGKTFQDLGISLQVSLIDEDTRDMVSTGPESSLPVEILVLDKDFNQENWTAEEFNSFVIEADDGRKRKRSLLCDKSRLLLRDGVATSHEISFRHTNQHMKKCEYRLGARIANPEYDGVRIKEAKTNPFTVKDKRIMSKKIYPASLDHEVWRLENISKDGPYHTRLRGRNINMVKDFLSEFNMDAVNLRDIVQMKSAKKWDATVNHAKTCALCPGEKYLYFLPDSQPRMGVVFNIVKEILGLYSEASMFVAVDRLANDQKAFLRELMVSATAHPDKVVTFDDVNGAAFEPNIVSTYPSNGPSNKKQESFESDHMSLFDDYDMGQFLQDSSLQYLTDRFDPQDFLKNMFKENKSMQPRPSY